MNYSTIGKTIKIYKQRIKYRLVQCKECGTFFSTMFYDYHLLCKDCRLPYKQDKHLELNYAFKTQLNKFIYKYHIKDPEKFSEFFLKIRLRRYIDIFDKRRYDYSLRLGIIMMYEIYCQIYPMYYINEHTYYSFCKFNKFNIYTKVKNQYYPLLLEELEIVNQRYLKNYIILSREEMVKDCIKSISSSIRKIGIAQSVIRIYELYKYDSKNVNPQVIACAYIYYYYARIVRKPIDKILLRLISGHNGFIRHGKNIKQKIDDYFELHGL